LLETWTAVQDFDPSSAVLDDSARASIACCAKVVAELADVGWLPEGLTRAELLRKAVTFAGAERPFTRHELAELEADLIEALFQDNLHDEGLARIDRARQSFADVPELLAEMLLLGANTREYLGDYAEALADAEESQALLQSLPPAAQANSYVWVYARVVHAKILIHMGVPDQAAPLLRDARRDADAGALEECQSMLLTGETELAQARGDWEWIVEHIGEALMRGAIPGDEPEDRAIRELVVAQAGAFLAMQSGRGLEEAHANLRSALEPIGLDDPSVWPAGLTLCDLELALDRPSQADEAARAVSARISASGKRPALVVRSHLAGVRGRIALALNLPLEEFSQRTSDAEDALMDLLGAWAAVRHRPGGVGFLHFDERRSLLVTLSQMLAGQRALDYLLEVEARGTLVQQLQATRISSIRVQEQLIPPGGGILIFLPSAWSSMAFTLDAQGLRSWPLPGTDSWADLDDRLVAAMQPEDAHVKGSAGRLGELATALRDRILSKDLDAHISRWEEVVLVRTENLGAIPFEVLPLAGRGGAPLGLELATSYLPSLSVGLGLTDRRAKRQAMLANGASARVLIAVGPTEERPADTNAQWQPIPWQRGDERRLCATWPEGFAEVVLDPDRALERLMRAGTDGVELVEIVAHGVRNADLERSQGFFLRSDRSVFADSLSDVRAAPLSVLMVCGASAGPTRQGDDLGSHLVAAFLAGGSDVVASSRTELSFEASVALLEEFHRNLALGETPSRALLAARRRLASQPDWAHPAFHSNLTLTGLGFAAAPAALRLAQPATPPEPEATPFRSVWIACAVLGLAVVVVVGLTKVRRRCPS
jgi:tetratricopeptide (TPR) repeat protein